MKTFIIAEAGANHNKDFSQAINLIDVAINSGATAIKFQTYSSNTLYAKRTPDFAGYKNINKLIDDIALPRSWQKDLKTYCDDNGIEFMSTPFDEQAVDELVSLDVKRMKISGFESTDPRFVELVASTGLPIVMSIGIGFDLHRMGIFLEIFKKYKNHLTLLHCNNAYPTPLEDISLNRMQVLQGFKLVDSVGLSDHTMSTLVPCLAVAKGASYIEKHFTLSRKMKGPDHPFALEPKELKEMVDLIRIAETVCSDKDELISKSEKPFNFARRSVVAKYEIKKGEIFSSDNLTTKRPFLHGNIPAVDWNKLLGKISKFNYQQDDFIKNCEYFSNI